MIGRAVEACTSATIPTEFEMVVIIQAAPTDWISEPKFEERLAIQIVRKVSFLNGASGDVRSVTSSTFLFDKNRLADPVIGEPVVNASHCIDPRRSTYVFNLKEVWEGLLLAVCNQPGVGT